MPNYSYRCQKCSFEDSHFQRLADAPIKKCPECRANKYERVFGEPNAIVRGNPRTFGAAAEENAKRVGKEQLDIMKSDNDFSTREFTGKLPKGAKRVARPKADFIPAWRDGSMGTPVMKKELNLKKVKNPQAYIETGKTT